MLSNFIFSFYCRVAFDTYVNPRLHISVYTPQRQTVESDQTIDSPAIVSKDYFFWGYTWYMQTPLENIGDDFTIEIELLHGPTATPPRVAAVSVYKINKMTIDSGFNTLQFSNLTGEEVAKKAAPVIKSTTDSSLECEFEITKFYRDVKLSSIA